VSRAVPRVRRMRPARSSAVGSCRPAVSTGRAARMGTSGRPCMSAARCCAVASSRRPGVSIRRTARMAGSSRACVTGARCAVVAGSGRPGVTGARTTGMARRAAMRSGGGMRRWSMRLRRRFRCAGMRSRSRMGGGRAVLLGQHERWRRYN
jgi:hypothetical protein